MAEVIRMPKMSDTMTEGVIAKWHKKVGDQVKSGDILAEVETDKATMELESYETGTLLHVGVKEKDSVPVDAIIAVIGKAGENIEGLLKGGSGNTASQSKPENIATVIPDTEKEVPVQNKEQAQSKPAANVKATIIKMPKMSDTMTEGTIVAWHKKVGDKVKSGELLAEVETDKATMELESYEDGTLLYVGVNKGESVKVDGILAIIGEKDADYKQLLNQPAAKTTSSSDSNKAAQANPEPVKEDKPAEKQHATGDERVKISPLAKKLAEEKGIDIGQIQGSGDNGRIVKRDVEEFKPKQGGAQKPTQPGSPQISTFAPGKESFEEIPVSQMRKTISKRLSESKFTAPHFYLTMEINMDKAVEARKGMNEFSPVKISFNDLVIKASAAALKVHPKVNSAWLGDKIRINHHIHIGVAVAVEEGLLVPVIRFADQKSLSQIAAEVKDLGGKAKEKKLQPKDWEGNTFTISNLGMFGIEEFTAIINPPDACILAVGAIREVPIVKNGQVVPGNMMKVTMSCDHRVVDGASGSAFLQTLKGLLEDPVRILV
jgi:pyruvate dehydrogenase E2 component (dihydrolipoamide acetyltransferase)